MKRSKFSDSQIIKALKENEAGCSVDEIRRDLGVYKGTMYGWRKKYDGMELSHLKRSKKLDLKNRKLKRMYADVSLDLQMAKDVYYQKSGRAF